MLQSERERGDRHAARSAEMSRSAPAESVSLAVLGGMGLGAALLAGGYLAGWLAQKKVARAQTQPDRVGPVV